ncbi:MAG: MFS transporter [Burkholderiales bacterium]
MSTDAVLIHQPRTATSLLLNIGHAIDHLMLLIFATAVGAIAIDFQLARWEDLMPFTVGAFFLFGLGSLPAGRLGDLWGRRAMMLIFFVGIGTSALLVAATQNVWQMAAALTLLGLFASIYHPVGIPMLVQSSTKPGITIGVNGLAGNLGIAIAALSTGFLVKHFGWRVAFVVPGLVAIACGIVFSIIAPRETIAPAKRKPKQVDLPPGLMARVFLIITLSATSSSLIFNFTTNGNGELLRERLAALIADPATIGSLLALMYTIASLMQLVVGNLIDRYPLKRIYLPLVLLQIPAFIVAATLDGWGFYLLSVTFMALVFGAIPFTDAMIVRYVDDRMRSRVAGARIAIAFGISSIAVYLLGPIVKVSGFGFLLVLMGGIATLTALAVAFLPGEIRQAEPVRT